MVRLAFISLLIATALVAADATCPVDSSFDTSIDRFPNKFNVTAAQQFALSYHNYYKVITVGAQRIALVQCGAPMPPASAGVFNNTISVPVSALAVASSPHVAHLEILRSSGSLAAWYGDASFISSPCVRQAVGVSTPGISAATPGVAAIAHARNASKPSWHGPDASELATLAGASATVLTVDSLPGGAFSAVSGSTTIHYVAVPEWQERSAVARLEHIAIIAAMLNKEAEATAHVNAVKARINCVRSEAATALTVAGTSQSSGFGDASVVLRLNIMWANYMGGAWPGAPDAWSLGTCPSYYCDAAAAAGGSILTGSALGLTRTTQVSWEAYDDDQVAIAARVADMIIYVGANLTDALEKKRSIFELSPGYLAGRIYDVNNRGPHDWREWAIVEPDVVVEDFLAAARPEVVNHTRVWLRKADEAIPQNAGTCNPSTTGQPEADACFAGAIVSKAFLTLPEDEGEKFDLVAVVVPIVVLFVLLIVVIVLIVVVLGQRSRLNGYKHPPNSVSAEHDL